MPEIEKLAYRMPEAVEASGLSRDSLYRAMARGELRSIKIGAVRLIPADALRDYLAEHEDRVPA